MWLHKPMSDRSCHWCYLCVAFLLEWMDTEDKQGYHRQSHPELFLFARPNVVCRFSEMIRRWNRGYSHSTEIGTGDGFSLRGKGLICYSSAVSVFNLCPGRKNIHFKSISFFLIQSFLQWRENGDRVALASCFLQSRLFISIIWILFSLIYVQIKENLRYSSSYWSWQELEVICHAVFHLPPHRRKQEVRAEGSWSRGELVTLHDGLTGIWSPK